MNHLTTKEYRKSYTKEKFLGSYTYKGNAWLIEKDWDESLLHQLPKALPRISPATVRKSKIHRKRGYATLVKWLYRPAQIKSQVDSNDGIFAFLEFSGNTFSAATLSIHSSSKKPAKHISQSNAAESFCAIITGVLLSAELDYLEVFIDEPAWDCAFKNYLKDNKIIESENTRKVFTPLHSLSILAKTPESPPPALEGLFSQKTKFVIIKDQWIRASENKDLIDNFKYLSNRLERHLTKLQMPKPKRRRSIIGRILFPRID